MMNFEQRVSILVILFGLMLIIKNTIGLYNSLKQRFAGRKARGETLCVTLYRERLARDLKEAGLEETIVFTDYDEKKQLVKS